MVPSLLQLGAAALFGSPVQDSGSPIRRCSVMPVPHSALIPASPEPAHSRLIQASCVDDARGGSSLACRLGRLLNPRAIVGRVQVKRRPRCDLDSVPGHVVGQAELISMPESITCRRRVVRRSDVAAPEVVEVVPVFEWPRFADRAGCQPRRCRTWVGHLNGRDGIGPRPLRRKANVVPVGRRGMAADASDRFENRRLREIPRRPGAGPTPRFRSPPPAGPSAPSSFLRRRRESLAGLSRWRWSRKTRLSRRRASRLRWQEQSERLQCC